MNGTYTRRYEMLVRVRDFGDTHHDLFPPTSLAGDAFATVRAAVANLVDHAATQESGRGSTREGSTSKAVAREALREDLEAIIRTARAMAVTTPGIDDKFRMPRGGDQHLLNAARAFTRDAAPLAQRFIEHYLPDDFLADLDQDVKNFESAMRGQDAGKGTKAAAAASIDAAMDAGLAAVVQLDAFVPNRVRNDPAKLAMWERARRVEYPSRSRADQPATPAQPSVPAGAAAAGV